MTSYQKLKAENIKLKQQLRLLATNPTCEQSIFILFTQKILAKQEEMFWNGNPANLLQDYTFK